MKKPYLTDALDSLRAVEPCLYVTQNETEISLSLYFRKEGKIINLGYISASKFNDEEFEVHGAAAYPSIGGAMYCFAMMALESSGYRLMSNRGGSSSEKAMAAWKRLENNPGIHSRPVKDSSWTEDVVDGIIDDLVKNNKMDEDEIFDLLDSEKFSSITPETFTKSYSCKKDEYYAKYVINHKENIVNQSELMQISESANTFYGECYDMRDSEDFKSELIFAEVVDSIMSNVGKEEAISANNYLEMEY